MGPGMTDDDLIARLRSGGVQRLGAMGVELHDAAADAIAALLARAEAAEAKLADWQASQHYRYIGKDGKPVLARDLEAALAAEQAKVGRLVDAMKALEKAAAEVSRRGAETGPQWTKLTVALLQARAALTQKDRTDG